MILITSFLATSAIASSDLKISFILDAEGSKENRELAVLAAEKAVKERECWSVDQVIVSKTKKISFSVYCKSFGEKEYNGSVLYSVLDLSDNWRTSSSEDRITGEVSHYAVSPWVVSETILDFPYTGVKSALGVGKKGKIVLSYIVFSDGIQLRGGEYKNGQVIYSLRANIDGETKIIQFSKGDNGSSLIPVNNKEFLNSVKLSKSIKLEIPIFNGSNAYYEYSMKDSLNAINTL